MKRYALPAALALTVAALAGCERPATTSSTTVVQPTKETVVQRDVAVTPAPAPSSSTTIINPPAPAAPPSSSTSVTIDANKPETTERSRSTTTERVDTPLGTATRTETTKSTTTR